MAKKTGKSPPTHGLPRKIREFREYKLQSFECMPSMACSPTGRLSAFDFDFLVEIPLFRSTFASYSLIAPFAQRSRATPSCSAQFRITPHQRSNDLRFASLKIEAVELKHRFIEGFVRLEQISRHGV